MLLTKNRRLAQKDNSQLTFNLDNDLKEVNPLLLQFIQSMVGEESGGEVTKHSRKVHIFFIIKTSFYFVKTPNHHLYKTY